MKKIFVIMAIIVASICIVLAALYGVILVSAAWKNFNTPPIVTKFVDDFYEAYNTRQVDYLYQAMTTKSFRDSISNEDFRNGMNNMYQKHGALAAKKRIGSKVGFKGARWIYTLIYSVQYEKGSGKDTFVLINDDNKLLLQYYSAD